MFGITDTSGGYQEPLTSFYQVFTLVYARIYKISIGKVARNLQRKKVYEANRDLPTCNTISDHDNQRNGLNDNHTK